MQVDYGLDAPGVVRGFAIAGGVLVIATVVAIAVGVPVAPELLGLCAVMFLATVAAMIHSSRRGKLLERDRMLDSLGLTGDEEVLDVGCGRGLLLVGAARRLPRGRAVGVDVWSAKDQSDNRREATLANAEAEGVADRVEVVDGDMRALPFGDASFDAVVSSIAIHNLEDADDRERACFEIARVLRPGSGPASRSRGSCGPAAGSPSSTCARPSSTRTPSRTRNSSTSRGRGGRFGCTRRCGS